MCPLDLRIKLKVNPLSHELSLERTVPELLVAELGLNRANFLSPEKGQNGPLSFSTPREMAQCMAASQTLASQATWGPALAASSQRQWLWPIWFFKEKALVNVACKLTRLRIGFGHSDETA